jgi:hypothetical protein
MAFSSNHHYVTVRDNAYAYGADVFERGLKMAKEQKIPYKFDGLNVSCPTFDDLQNLYNLFFTLDNFDLRIIYRAGYQFKDLGSRIYFRVGSSIVQIWSYAAENSEKLSEGAGGNRVYLPVYCSFNAINDLVFDSVHVASIFY